MIRKRAFTLIELLVVIAIIAMLLAILVPVLRKAKSQARDLIDRTNLRSLGLAADLYLTQNKEKLFVYSTTDLWMQKIGEMIDNIDKIRFCPKTIAKIDEVKLAHPTGTYWANFSNEPWVWHPASLPEGEMGSYGINGWLYAEPDAYVCATDKDKPFGKRTGVKIPSQTPLFLDANWVDGWPKNTNVLPATGYNYDAGDHAPGDSCGTTQIGRFVLNRHGPETTVVFADAHAETIPHAKLWALAWHKGSTPNFNPVIPQPIPKKE